jgi:predicted RNA-binding Zn-ribbon protein involved in translation (DUF1610 family)
MPEIKYVKCPSCGWVGDSDPTPIEIYENLKTEVTTVIKTLQLNNSSNYGFSGSYAICPNCGKDLSDGNFSVNSDYLC